MGEMADYYLDLAHDPEYDDETGEEVGDGISFSHQYGPHGPGKCPDCGAKTKPLTGKFGPFWGCTSFPECKGSRGA